MVGAAGAVFAQAAAEFAHGQQGDGRAIGQTLQPSGLIGVGVVAALSRYHPQFTDSSTVRPSYRCLFHVKQHRLVLQDGARHAARFYVKGLSSQAGPRPRWLEACTAHLVTGLTPGSAVLDLDVLITGTAHYRPSGSIQQIAVDDLHRAEPRDDLFAHIPLPPSRQPVFRSLPHDQRSGVASFVGTWPGDESDAELIEALQAIR